jgi:hypothetical protein
MARQIGSKHTITVCKTAKLWQPHLARDHRAMDEDDLRCVRRSGRIEEEIHRHHESHMDRRVDAVASWFTTSRSRLTSP